MPNWQLFYINSLNIIFPFVHLDRSLEKLKSALTLTGFTSIEVVSSLFLFHYFFIILKSPVVFYTKYQFVLINFFLIENLSASLLEVRLSNAYLLLFFFFFGSLHILGFCVQQ